MLKWFKTFNESLSAVDRSSKNSDNMLTSRMLLSWSKGSKQLRLKEIDNFTCGENNKTLICRLMNIFIIISWLSQHCHCMRQLAQQSVLHSAIADLYWLHIAMWYQIQQNLRALWRLFSDWIRHLIQWLLHLWLVWCFINNVIKVFDQQTDRQWVWRLLDSSQLKIDDHDSYIQFLL